MRNILVAFDLDDTLYAEMSFVRSGMGEVERVLSSHPEYPITSEQAYESLSHGRNPFEPLIESLKPDNPDNEAIVEALRSLDHEYKTHRPDIRLFADAMECLKALHGNYPLALITDGRAKIQLNKVKALGLNRYIPVRRMYISEISGADKTTDVPFRLAMASGRYDACVYVGDNVQKDFHHPNLLGWHTVGIADRGENIFPQKGFAVPAPNAPRHVIQSLTQLPPLLQQLFPEEG